MGLADGPVVDGGLPHEDGDVQAQRRGEGLESVMCLLLWNFPTYNQFPPYHIIDDLA